MQFSKRIGKVAPSATLSINAKANELRAAGKDVISLAAGEPDFLPPRHVLEAGKNALEEGFVRYTPVAGLSELREAIASFYAKSFRISLGPEMVICTNGGKQALYNIFQIILDSEDAVLIPAPYWVSYPDMVRLAEGKTKVVPTSPENNFLTSPQELENYIDSGTKALILNSPSNPTGCHYTQEQLDEIVRWAISKGLFVISDEIYDQLVYPPAKPASCAKWLDSHPDSIAIVNGLSKSFACTGLRIGYLLSSPEIVKDLSKIQGQSTSNICTVAQHAALAAFQGSWDFLEEARELFAQRRDKALEEVNSWTNVVCPKPDGAFYLFPSFEQAFTKKYSDSSSLCTFILEQAEVALVPGTAFGDDRCLRLSYATDEKTLIRALQRIGKALQGLS